MINRRSLFLLSYLSTSGKPVVQGQSYSTGVQSSSVEATSETYLLEQKNPKWNLKDVFKKKKGIAKVAVTPSNNSLSDLAQPTSLYDNTDTSPYETHITAETETEHERTPKVSNDKLTNRYSCYYCYLFIFSLFLVALVLHLYQLQKAMQFQYFCMTIRLVIHILRHNKHLQV